MRDREGTKRSGAIIVALAACLGCASVASAQEPEGDAQGRAYFERGRAAFENADYERALVYFRHAYRLSGRPELQYNIGVAADRLQREDEALEAFERYLADAQSPPREAEVRERIGALRASIERREATERALAEATTRFASSDQPREIDGHRLPKSTVAGGTALAALGAAGVAAMAVGLARDGSCKDERAGVCVTEHSATAWTWVYGGVGIAALGASAAWFGVSVKRKRSGEKETTWTISPTGVQVSGKF
jgi:tetratricopeptide (TPR) repeat protein